MPRPATPTVSLEGVSKGEINRAGEQLRSLYENPPPPGLGPEDLPQDLVTSWILVFFAYRPTFQTPLDKVHVTLTRWAARATGDDTIRKRVAQRLKRESQIIDKLRRHKKMKLARMEDIAGCRAVLPSQELVNRLADRVRDSWDVTDSKDYVANPTKWGYRAIHLAVMRDERLVEIQLRTPSQHQWALAVERMGNRLNQPLKFGKGPPDLLRYFRLASQGMALEERGGTPDDAFIREFDEAVREIDRYRERR